MYASKKCMESIFKIICRNMLCISSRTLELSSLLIYKRKNNFNLQSKRIDGEHSNFCSLCIFFQMIQSDEGEF